MTGLTLEQDSYTWTLEEMLSVLFSEAALHGDMGDVDTMVSDVMLARLPEAFSALLAGKAILVCTPAGFGLAWGPHPPPATPEAAVLLEAAMASAEAARTLFASGASPHLALDKMVECLRTSHPAVAKLGGPEDVAFHAEMLRVLEAAEGASLDTRMSAVADVSRMLDMRASRSASRSGPPDGLVSKWALPADEPSEGISVPFGDKDIHIYGRVSRLVSDLVEALEPIDLVSVGHGKGCSCGRPACKVWLALWRLVLALGQESASGKEVS